MKRSHTQPIPLLGVLAAVALVAAGLFAQLAPTGPALPGPEGASVRALPAAAPAAPAGEAAVTTPGDPAAAAEAAALPAPAAEAATAVQAAAEAASGLAFTARLASSANATLAAAAGATLSTDKRHYWQGQIIYITGANFTPGAVLTSVSIVRPDGVTDAAATKDNNVSPTGTFNATYIAPGINGVYRISATDAAGVTADTRVADPAVAGIDVYSQCSNDDGDGYATGDTGCRWTNGNLQSNNSTYTEGDGTVQRLAISDVPNGEHTVTIRYGTTKGGKHAYDFLVEDKFSEDWVTDADFCDSPITNMANCSTMAGVRARARTERS